MGPDLVANNLKVCATKSLLVLDTMLLLYEKQKVNVRYCRLEIPSESLLIQEAFANQARSCSANDC